MIKDSLLKKIKSWFSQSQKIRIVSDPRELADLPKGSIVIAGTRITVIEPADASR
ncbi:MAG: hypothetical protein AAGB06_04855 [Verrucomicrobiota bacterium]